MFKLKAFAINFFKSYKNLPFSTLFLVRETRRSVWALKELFPELEKINALIYSYLNYLGRYKQANLELAKANAKNSTDAKELEKQAIAYHKALDGLVDLLHANITQFVKRFEESFQRIENIEVSGNALFYRNTNFMIHAENEALDVLQRLYDKEAAHLRKEMLEAVAARKKAAKQAKKKGQKLDLAQFDQKLADLKQKRIQNNSALQGSTASIKEKFAAIQMKTINVLNILKRSSKAQAADTAEPLNAANHLPDDEILRYIKIGAKEIAALVHEENKIKQEMQRAQNYDQFWDAFDRLKELYLKNVGAAYHLIEHDKLIIYHLKRMFDRLKAALQALELEETKKLLENSEKAVHDMKSRIEDLEQALHSNLNQIADQSRLINHELVARQNAALSRSAARLANLAKKAEEPALV